MDSYSPCLHFVHARKNDTIRLNTHHHAIVEMGLAEFIKDYFSQENAITEFNNSQITTMRFHYKRKIVKWYIPALFGEIEWFPYEATNMEIANVFKDLLTVPFTISVGRENNKIYSIVVARVFL